MLTQLYPKQVQRGLEPVQKITLEDLIEADERVAGEEEKERMREEKEEEAWEKILETMTVEERV